MEDKKIGFTIGKFAPFHKGHEFLIETGLKDMDESRVENEIQNAGVQKGVAVIASHMNYGLYRVENEGNCPRDAFRICRLLGLQSDVMNLLDEQD